MVQEQKEHTYTMKGKEIREQLGLKGIISHIDVSWERYNDKADECKSKTYPVLTISTKDSIDVTSSE